jgi:hypothetical protein
VWAPAVGALSISAHFGTKRHNIGTAFVLKLPAKIVHNINGMCEAGNAQLNFGTFGTAF